jgi:TPR repeat protein
MTHSLRTAAFAATLLATLSACTTVDGSLRLPADASPVVRRYAEECGEGTLTSCYALGLAWDAGEDAGHGLTRNPERATALLSRACEGGVEQACAAASAIAEGSAPGPVAPPEGMNQVPDEGSE